MRKIELLLPAGDLNRLKTAIIYGADAVYIGGTQFSLRAAASNFSIAQIQEGVAFAKAHQAQVHVTMNMIPHDEDLENIDSYMIQLQEVGVKALIIASPYIAMRAKMLVPKMEVHLSTQHSTTNSLAIAYWQQKNIDRIVLAREVSLAQMKAIKAQTSMHLEVFIHGAMCISYSGRCVLSNHMTLRDANRGGCAQSCRWDYRMYQSQKPIHDETHPFTMSSKDLMGIDYVYDLMKANIASLKIEGRMKSAYYIASITKTYRMLIDEIMASGKLSESRMLYYRKEVAKAENRSCAQGFFDTLPDASGQLYHPRDAAVSQEFIANVLAYDTIKQVATLQVRNHFSINTEVEAFGPHLLSTKFCLNQMWDEEGQEMNVANSPMQIVFIATTVQLEQGAMIRKVMPDTLSNERGDPNENQR